MPTQKSPTRAALNAHEQKTASKLSPYSKKAATVALSDLPETTLSDASLATSSNNTGCKSLGLPMVKRQSMADYKRDHAGHGLFADPAAIKQRIKANLCKTKYDVTDLYNDKGIAQTLAKSPMFEQCGMVVIALNAVWIAIDTDWNDEPLLNNSHAVFQIFEHFFCSFFVFEWTVRLCAFKRKLDAFWDTWFLFDTGLVALMVGETWVMNVIIAANGSTQSQSLGDTSVLKLVRLLRLTRVARLARLLKEIPELMILIKGMVAATRSVFFTWCLLIMVIYVFGIAFCQLTKDSALGEKYFTTVPIAMLTLLLRGTYLDEITEIMWDMKEESIILVFLFLVFVLMAAQTLLNMLIGVLVEVVSVVAAVETEELQMNFAIHKLGGILTGLDIDHNQLISKKEFVTMITNNEAVQALEDVGVDAVGLVDFVDIIFRDECDVEGALSFQAFMEIVLQFRGSNQCTVKDLMETQKTLRAQIKILGNSIRLLLDSPHQSPTNQHKDPRGSDHRGSWLLHTHSLHPDASHSNDHPRGHDMGHMPRRLSVHSNPEEGAHPFNVNAEDAFDATAETKFRPKEIRKLAKPDQQLDTDVGTTLQEQKSSPAAKPASTRSSTGATPNIKKDLDDCAEPFPLIDNSQDTLENVFAATAAAIQRSVMHGHMSMQRLLSQQIQHKEREALQRMATDGHTVQLTSEVASLREENRRLRELLAGTQGAAVSTALSTTVDHDDLARNDGRTASRVPYEDELKFFLTPVDHQALLAAQNLEQEALHSAARLRDLEPPPRQPTMAESGLDTQSKAFQVGPQVPIPPSDHLPGSVAFASSPLPPTEEAPSLQVQPSYANGQASK